MSKAYTQPWFLLYALVITVCFVSSIWFGFLSIVIACIPMVLVDLGIWPKSAEWIKVSKKFRLRHRIFAGGMNVVIVITYLLIGPQSIPINLIILGIILQWIERLIRIK